MPSVNLSVLNQRQSPALYADILANIPAAGYLGRIFWSTDTFAIYRDNGTGWDLFGGPGTGTVTGTGTAGQIAIWSGTSVIGGKETTGSGSVVLNNSPALTTPSFTSVNVVGGVAAMPTGSGTLLYSSALGSYVPYTGATADLNLGANNINAANIISSGKLGFSATEYFSLPAAGIIRTTNRLDATGDLYTNAIQNYNASLLNIGNSSYPLQINGSTITVAQALTASSSITAASLIKTGSSNSFFLLGGGGMVATSSFAPATGGSYLPLAGGNLTGVVNSTSRLNLGGATDNVSYQLRITGNAALSGSIAASTNMYLDANNTFLYGRSSNNIFDRKLIGFDASDLVSIDPQQLGTVIGGITKTLSRLNVNGATDSSLFALNVSGTVNGSSPSFTGNTYTVTGNLTQQFYHVFTGAVGQTLTVPTPSGNNSQYLIVNNSANILTVAAYSGTNIITLIGTTSATITLAANARVLLVADGNNKYYQAF